MNIELAEKIGVLFKEIETTSSEQASGIEQISKAMSEISKVVQNNSSSAEESASAAEEMNAQAQSVKGFVQDLIRVVGGNGKNGHGNIAVLEYRPDSITHKAVTMISRRKDHADNVAKGTRLVRPTDMIPMDKNNFRDF